MASNVDDWDESFISKFRDYFIEEDDADSAGISPYASVSEADSCIYYTVEDFLSKFGRHEKNSFAIASLNIRSLPGQWDALRLLVQELNSGTVKLSVLCLQEIWCVPPYEDFALDGYHPIVYSQRDPSGRNRNAGGGVALWCIFEPHVFESVFVKIEVTPRKFLVVGNTYRPPNAYLTTFNTKLAFIQEKIHEQYSGTHDVQLCLDSNIDLFQISSSSHHSEYFNTLLGAGHLPLITIPTRTAEVTRHDRGSGITHTLIDHIMSKRHVPPPSGVIRHYMSDHDITFSIQELGHAKQPKSEVYTQKITEAKTKTFCELLKAADWSQVIATSEPDVALLKLHSNLEDCYNEAFPLCNSSFNKRYNAINPWMSKALLVS